MILKSLDLGVRSMVNHCIENITKYSTYSPSFNFISFYHYCLLYIFLYIRHPNGTSQTSKIQEFIEIEKKKPLNV